MKKIVLFFAVIVLAFAANAQIVNIPDVNFKAALISHSPVIDTNGDGEIQVSEAEAYTGEIYVGYKNIADLTGIETFVNLKELDCTLTQLVSLDLSNNTALCSLDCSANQLTSLKLGNNTSLTFVRCYSNYLTSLNVSQNTSLITLDCYNNPLETIDVSQNIALEEFHCAANQL